MLSSKFGIEIEFTGITRNKAARVAAGFLHGSITANHDHYDSYSVKASDNRIWKFMSDASLSCQKKQGRQTVSASSKYSVELVSPVLTYYHDIGTLQELARCLRKAGGFVNPSCGIHIHLDGVNHTPRSLRNFVNMIASKNDLLYKALQIEPARMQYCKKVDAYLVEQLNSQKPTSFEQIETIWYAPYAGNPAQHYHHSRYHWLNLHSFFHGHHTVELRGFNSTLHAGKIRAYIVLALALNHQALTQKSARYQKVQAENEKFAMRTYLCRLGLNGDEFKNCREHLCQHLSGNSAWRYGSRENVCRHIGNGGTNREN